MPINCDLIAFVPRGSGSAAPGKLDLVLASVNLNVLVGQCVALMQPQANQQRIIIRSSLSPSLPPVMADARSVRQIALNLLSNSIKFTGAGGQVIISTAATEHRSEERRVGKGCRSRGSRDHL